MLRGAQRTLTLTLTLTLTVTRCELVQLEHEPVKDDNGVEQSMA